MNFLNNTQIVFWKIVIDCIKMKTIIFKIIFFFF